MVPKRSSDLLEKVRAPAMALPGVEESTSYGTPAFKVKGKLFARLHQDGESLVVRTNLIDREILLAAAPKVFFLTEHYEPHPWVLVHLGVVKAAQLAKILKQAWEEVAPAPRRAAR